MIDHIQLSHSKWTGLFHHPDAMVIDILARTIWGEARGDGVRGMNAVAHVIKNRVDIAQDQGGSWWGNDLIAVCRKPYQFSCWNARDPNRDQVRAVNARNAVFRQALVIATRTVIGDVDDDQDKEGADIDPTHGATHYHHFKMLPPWAVGCTPTCRIGGHVFYDLRKDA